MDDTDRKYREYKRLEGTMKKVLIPLLLVISATFVCAGESQSLFDLYWNTTLVPVDYSFLSQVSFLEPLSDSTSREIERDRKTDRLIGVLVNLLIPGLGSLIIGDTKSGIISMVGYYLSVAVGFGGYFVYYPMAETAGTYPGLAMQNGIIISGFGLLGMVVFTIYGIASPFTYVKNKDYH